MTRNDPDGSAMIHNSYWGKRSDGKAHRVANLRLLGALATLSAAVSAVLCGCADYSQLSFRQDKRLQVIAPADRSTVELPVTLRWQIRDFTVPEQGSFALFVDRAPVPGGKALSHVARRDRGCRADAGCPDADYLAAHEVFTTSDTEYTFENLPAPAHPDSRQPERHRVTIVLLDSTGHRIGESAWSVEFTVRREVP
jgi:hypothetical protein